MSDNVTSFPTFERPNLFGPKLVGNSLIVEKRLVPYFHIHDRGGEVEFVLDGRICFSFPKEIAHLAAAMAANALAIGAGYSHLGALVKDRPFAPEVFELTDGIRS